MVHASAAGRTRRIRSVGCLLPRGRGLLGYAQRRFRQPVLPSSPAARVGRIVEHRNPVWPVRRLARRHQLQQRRPLRRGGAGTGLLLGHLVQRFHLVTGRLRHTWRLPECRIMRIVDAVLRCRLGSSRRGARAGMRHIFVRANEVASAQRWQLRFPPRDLVRVCDELPGCRLRGDAVPVRRWGAVLFPGQPPLYGLRLDREPTAGSGRRPVGRVVRGRRHVHDGLERVLPRRTASLCSDIRRLGMVGAIAPSGISHGIGHPRSGSVPEHDGVFRSGILRFGRWAAAASRVRPANCPVGSIGRDIRRPQWKGIALVGAAAQRWCRDALRLRGSRLPGL